MYYILILLITILPLTTSAQSTGSLQGLIAGTLGFLNEVIVPLILGIAGLIFIVNAIRFFVIGGSNEDSQKNAKNLALYGIGAFVFILSFWGIVNVVGGGIGLNVEPCTQDQISDYVVRETSPCTRTSEPPPTVGTGVSPLTPPTGITGSGVNVGGTDTPPSIVTPIPPTSFTPDGQPIITGQQGAIEQAQTLAMAAEISIRTGATNYFSTDMETDFGYNTNIVNEALMADFYTTRADTTSNIERVRAAARLVELNVIAEQRLTNYVSTLNAYYTAAGQTSGFIDANTTADLTAPTPSTLIQNRDATKAQLVDALTVYTSPQQAQTLADAVYDTSVDSDTRYDRILDLYYSGGNYAPYLSPNNPAHNELLTRFVNDINAENIFNADFNMVQ